MVFTVAVRHNIDLTRVLRIVEDRNKIHFRQIIVVEIQLLFSSKANALGIRLLPAWSTVGPCKFEMKSEYVELKLSN